jgi:hypothetical protein
LEINCHPKRSIDVALLLFLPVASGRRAFPPAPPAPKQRLPSSSEIAGVDSISEFQSVSYFKTESFSTKTTNIQYFTFYTHRPQWRTISCVAFCLSVFVAFDDGMSHSIEVRLIDIDMNIL